MKTKLFLLVILLFFSHCSFKCLSQIPYFAGTVGKNKLYAYTSLKIRPGENAQETYTTFQYGLSPHSAVGLDLYTSNGNAYMGYLVRGGYKFNKWIGVGIQLTPSFNLSDNYRFDYMTTGLYLNGAITDDCRLFWCSNTWWIFNYDFENTITNWEYFGYTIPTVKNQSVTPMVGLIHSWKFDTPIDIAIGAYYTVNRWNFYLWGNDFFKENPRIVIGAEITI